MVNKLKKEVREFLEGKTTSEGERVWHNWFDLPNQKESYKKNIVSSPADLKREIKAIKRKSFSIFGLNYNQLQIAASLVLCLGVGTWFYMNATTVFSTDKTLAQTRTQAGQRIKVTLKDGTQIWLNAGSILKYPNDFEGDTREVYLEGEAFFDVAKDKAHPFIIHTSKMDTKVLGTSFNVQAYPNQEKQVVAVVTGKVSVQSTITDEKIVVTPGQKALLAKNTNRLQAQKNIKITSISTWRKNILSFDDTPLNEAVETIARNYNVAIQLEDKGLSNLRINASFEKLTPTQIVDLLCKTINATCVKKDTLYTIKAK